MLLERVACGGLGNIYDSSRVMVSGHVAGTSVVWCSRKPLLERVSCGALGNIYDSSRVMVSGHVAGTSVVWCSGNLDDSSRVLVSGHVAEPYQMFNLRKRNRTREISVCIGNLKGTFHVSTAWQAKVSLTCPCMQRIRKFHIFPSV